MNRLQQAQISQLKAAAEIWSDIQNTKEPADRWLGNYFHRNRKKFGSRDRRFLSEITYSLFRNKLLFEYQAKAVGKENDIPFLVQLAAEYEGLLPKGGNVIPAKAGIHGSPIKAFGDDTNIQDNLSLHYSFPLWIVHRWHKSFGEELEKILISLNERPPLVIRVNTLKISRQKLIARFQKKGFQLNSTSIAKTGIRFSERVNLFDSEEFREGFFEIQDEGSQILCEKIAPKPGEIIWDVCAGGGGKSLALASLMANKGRIIATDIRSQKLMDLKKRARRAGVNNIFPAELTRVSEIYVMKNRADKILVDAPCSGTGTFRRNPDAKWKIREEDFYRFHQEQLKILEQAIPYLKKGGVLYYATCSLESEENESVVEELLKKHPELTPTDVGDQGKPYLRLWPHQQGTDGFFLAAMRKQN